MNEQLVRLFFLLSFVYCVWGNNNKTIACCSPSQVVRFSSHVCVDLRTNITSPMSLQCKVYFKLSHFNVTEDQQVAIQQHRDVADIHLFNEFCVGNISMNKGTKKVLNVILCEDEDNQIIDEKVLGYCLIISLIFLVPTALVYSAFKELRACTPTSCRRMGVRVMDPGAPIAQHRYNVGRHNLPHCHLPSAGWVHERDKFRDVQGKSIINLCISLAIGEGILAYLKIMGYSNMALCVAQGFLAYFFMVAAFFWTNAIAIQVLLNMRRPTILDNTWHEFKWYFIYAWGVPTLLTTCMGIVNFLPGNHSKPHIGLVNCWFINKKQQWYYMYSVLCILMAVNVAIFVYVAVMLCRLNFSPNHLKGLKFKLVMSARLILLMGLPWIFDMISFEVGEHIISTIIDVLNSLQGLFIFLLLVVFRRRVIKIMYKHGWLNCISGAVEKHLAFEDDEENVVQHTDVALNLNDRSIN